MQDQAKKSVKIIKYFITGIVNAVSFIGIMVFQYIAGSLIGGCGGINIIYLVLTGLGLIAIASVFLKVIYNNYESNDIYKINC